MSLTSSPRRSSQALRLAAAGTAAGVLLAACSASSSDDATTTLSFFSWESEATMRPLIDAFEEENSDITIEFSYAPPVAEYIQTLQTRISSGTAADVFQMAAENKATLIDNGSTMPLTDEPFMSVIADFNRETYSREGVVYAMSTTSWGGGIFYNTELLAEAGMAEPPGTWDELLDLMTQVEAATGVEPFYDNELAQIPFSLQALLGSSYGDESVDEEIFGGGQSFADAWAEPVARWYEPYEQGLIDSAVVGLSDDQIVDEFANGRVAMIVTGPWSVATIRASNPDLDFAIMPVPAPEGQSAVLPGAASPGYAINAATDNVEAAERFLEFMSSPAAQELIQEGTSAIPTTVDFEPALDPVLDPLIEPVRDGQLYLAQIAWPDHQDTLTTEAVSSIQQLVLGQVDTSGVGANLDRRFAEMQG